MSRIEAIVVQEHGAAVEGYTYEETGELPADGVELVVHACALGAGDVQQLRGDWGPCILPLVPGREAVGVVARVGEAVKTVKKGDRVAVLLGTGLDSEIEDDGADRSALDDLTTGAAAHRLRVPARWAFPLPLGLPSAQAAGLLGAGGAVWSQLTQRKLPRGAKVGVLGTGAAAGLALQLADAMGYDAYSVGVGSRPSPPRPPPKPTTTSEDEDDDDDDDDDDEDAGAGGLECGYVDASDLEALRLHTGTFDALLVAEPSPHVDLSAYLALATRGGQLLLISSSPASLSLPPRVLQERRLAVHSSPPLSAKQLVGMLGFVCAKKLSWDAQHGELTADGAAAALAALEASPGSRAVLMREEEHAKWLKRARRLRASGAADAAQSSSSMSIPGLGSLGSTSALSSSVFGVFSKVADQTRAAGKAMSDGLREQTAKLVEQVEREVEEEEQAKFGALDLGTASVSADDDEGEEDDEYEEEEWDDEGEEDDDEEYDDEDDDEEYDDDEDDEDDDDDEYDDDDDDVDDDDEEEDDDDDDEEEDDD